MAHIHYTGIILFQQKLRYYKKHSKASTRMYIKKKCPGHSIHWERKWCLKKKKCAVEWRGLLPLGWDPRLLHAESSHLFEGKRLQRGTWVYLHLTVPPCKWPSVTKHQNSQPSWRWCTEAGSDKWLVVEFSILLFNSLISLCLHIYGQQ